MTKEFSDFDSLAYPQLARSPSNQSYQIYPSIKPSQALPLKLGDEVPASPLMNNMNWETASQPESQKEFRMDNQSVGEFNDSLHQLSHLMSPKSFKEFNMEGVDSKR